MTTMWVTLGRHDTTVVVDDRSMVLAVGIDSLVERELLSDPPRPEELTNAIGAVLDHFDDVVRDLPDAIGAEVHVCGIEAGAIAAVELGSAALLPFVLSRDAAEDVFRTLATESRVERARNPGLDPTLVGSVVAGCCAMVAIMRRLQLDEITVDP